MTKHPELKTLRDFLRFATSRFNEAGLYYGHGTDNAWDEAVALILPSLHLPMDSSPSILDAQLTEKEHQLLIELINKRVNERIPAAYLTHQAWFAGLSFYVDERVLIPRSPIAELIEDQFEPWIDPHHVKNILDLCTGSGCIAIACAKYFPDAEVDASDISKDALAVAKINISRHEVSNQVHLYESDLFSSLPPKKYDIIVSNPPYVSLPEMQELPAEYYHEPSLGLTAGEKGLECVLKILKTARDYLSPEGILIVEVGNSEYALSEYFPNIPFTWLEFTRGGGGVFLLTTEQISMSLKYMSS